MITTEITERVNSLGQAWEKFKYINDKRLNQIERKTMTQQTPHARALEASRYEDNFVDALEAYLTTLLDSPEMVDKIKQTLDDLWVEDAEVTMRQTAQAVIAAIKKEAGL
jgi:hypothetical protein